MPEISEVDFPDSAASQGNAVEQGGPGAAPDTRMQGEFDKLRPSMAQPQKDDSGSFWRVFASTFGAIFLAEIGDKTQVATLLMSAESGRPWIVFLGAGTALVATSLMGVALGQWLSRRVSTQLLDTAAGAVLLLITVWLLWDVMTV